MFNKKIKNRITLLNDSDLETFIDANTEVVFVAPWNGSQLPVCIKMLDSVVLNSCGVFNTVSPIVNAKGEKEPDIKEIIKTKNIHENLVKAALVNPTFKQLEDHLLTKDFYKNIRAQIEEVKKEIDSVESTEEKEAFQKEIDELELMIAFTLPEDFTLAIVTVLMQGRATDLGKLTRNTLLEAGFLGEKYNTRPSEYLSGIFTDKQKVDIDVTAFTLVADYREQKKLEKNGMNWIGRKNGS